MTVISASTGIGCRIDEPLTSEMLSSAATLNDSVRDPNSLEV